MQLKNETPYFLGQVVELDREAAEHLVVVLKATYSIGTGGNLTVAEEQDPISLMDEFHGEPDASSISREAEMGSIKPATDCLLTGCAVAPRRNTRAMDVLFQVGRLRKVVRVFGNRKWEKSVARKKAGDPQPFEKVPLVWENAFGGVDESPKNEKHHAQEARNPVGRGFRGKRSQLPWEGELLPNLEHPKELISGPDDRPRPRAFAPIGRHWLPRRTYAGTYDQKWIDERLPLLPDDFDDRFHHAAPPDQIVPGYLKGGEPVKIVGCSEEGEWKFELPRVTPFLEARLRSRIEEPPMVLETVGVDTEARTLRLVFKGRVRIHGELPDLRYVRCAVEEEADA